MANSPEGDNAAFAVSNSTLFSIDLETGAATSLGSIGDRPVGDLLGFVALSTPLVGGPAPDMMDPGHGEDGHDMGPGPVFPRFSLDGHPQQALLEAGLANLLEVRSMGRSIGSSRGGALFGPSAIETILSSLETNSAMTGVEPDSAAMMMV